MGVTNSKHESNFGVLNEMAAKAAVAIAKQTDNTTIGRRVVQNFRLVWLDAIIEESHEDFRDTIAELRGIVHTVDAFADADQCINFLNKIEQEDVFMIVSGSLGQQTVPSIHDISQLTSIFVFCRDKARHEQWAKDWWKVKGVFTELERVYEALKTAARQCDRDTISMSFVSVDEISNKNLDKLDRSFMVTHFLKEMLLEIDFDEQSNTYLATYCRDQCANNRDELKNIAIFNREYRQKSPIWWYTYECFLYPMLNRVLRNQEVDVIIKMGFFIRDLHEQIQKLHTEQFKDIPVVPLTFYRGQVLSKENFEKLQNTKGGLITFNNFFSASRNREVSQEFATNSLRDPQSVGILFKMPIINPATSSAPFALINKFSCQPTDEDILFSMHTIFRIRNIQPIDNNDRLWQVRLMVMSANDEQLNNLIRRIEEETERSSRWDRLGILLIESGKFHQAEQVYRVLLEDATEDLDRALIYHQLGRIKREQGEYETAIAFHEKALDIRQKAVPQRYFDLSASYTSIGAVYESMRQYWKALSSHEKALDITEEALPPRHPDLVPLYNNIGSVYQNMGENGKALSFFEKALEIRQKTPPSDHLDLAQSYNNIGLLHDNMGKYARALTFYEKALQINEKNLHANHPNVASSYHNVADVYSNMGNYSKALSFYEKGLEIRQKILPSNHPDLITSYNNIGAVYYSMSKYSQALSSFEKSLELRQKILPPNHPDLAATCNRIGDIHEMMGEYAKALPFFERSVVIGERSLPPNHPNLQLYRRHLEIIKRKCKK